MLVEEVLEKIKSKKYVYMKVSFNHHAEAARLEITSWTFNVLGSYIYQKETANEAIESAQRKMLKVAGDYENKGFLVIINPFTN